MQVLLQIAFDGVDRSESVETRVEEKLKKLSKLYDNITACRVTIQSHHRNSSPLHHKGEPFHVTINLTVPGEELVVRRTPKDPHVHEDISVALRDAFDAMGRQLTEYADRRRGAVKTHAG